jgi:type III restriction enzyme
MTVDIMYDAALITRIADAFDLRAPNRDALAAIIRSIETGRRPREYVADLATGVGKTFLMAALVDYLAEQGVRNILVVTPGKVVQEKTIANFDEASYKYVRGADAAPVVVTPATYLAQRATLMDTSQLKVMVFNIQQLLDSREGVNLGTRKHQEALGASLYGYLQSLDDLIVIADEHHLYHAKAKAFSAALRELGAVATIGLTATPSVSDRDKLVFEYTLGDAIADGFVKRPVIVYRPGGTHDERVQLLDALDVLRVKQTAYAAQSSRSGRMVHACLFVVASTIDHAVDVASELAGPSMLNDPDAVLTITSESSQDDLQRLADVESPKSAVRAIVSVNKLREGWDVCNIAVLVALRRLASAALTEQVMGRGLRLPFGSRTGVPMVDTLDIIAHDSYKQLLAQKDLLAERTMSDSEPAPVDEQGYAPVPAGLVNAVDQDAWDGETLDAPHEVDGPGTATLVTHPSGAPLIGSSDLASRTVAQRAPLVIGAPADRRIVFPLPTVSSQPSPFELVSISDRDIRSAGERHLASAEQDEVSRTGLTATRQGTSVVIGTIAEQGMFVTTKDATDRDAVVAALRRSIMAAAKELPQTAETAIRVGRIVDKFLTYAGAETDWTPQWLERASRGIASLIRQQMAQHKAATTWTVQLARLAVPTRTVVVTGTERQAHVGNFTPVRHEKVGGWYKHLLPLTTFDAVSTEWEIARILDRSPSIDRWLRLERADGVVVTGGHGFVTYWPDFIAVDTAGIHWLIEGKDDERASSDSVQAKKAAAEQWARRASDSTLFQEQWRYMFITESAIAAASEQWSGLKGSAEVGGD